MLIPMSLPGEDTAAVVHRYTARCTWSGSTGVGYEHYYDREHDGRRTPGAGWDADALGGPGVSWRSPRVMNPEQLLVMAAASCQLLSFLAVAARARLDVVAYDDNAEAEMPEA